MISNNDEYFGALSKFLADDPDMVFISTYGIYAGICANGDDISSKGYGQNVNNFLSSIKCQVKTLVGLTPYIPCRTDCYECKEKHISYCDRTLQTALAWPHFSWRFTTGYHTKFIGFVKGSEIYGAVIGGRNLTGSNWEDLNFIATPDMYNGLFRYFAEHFNKSQAINETNINNYLMRAV